MSALYLYHACPQIAMENMQGTASSKPLYKQLLCVNYFSYQCSESSHASEIEQVLLYLGQHLERAWSDLCGVPVDGDSSSETDVTLLSDPAWSLTHTEVAQASSFVPAMALSNVIE